MCGFFKKTFLNTYIRILFMALAFELYAPIQAQSFISHNPEYLNVKTEKDNLISTFKNTYPDTSVTNLNNFFPRNFMGNIGLPSPDYFLNYGTDDLGFRYFNAPTTNDRIKENQVEYYRSKGPFADLTAISGSKLLQAFKLNFTATYKDKVNINLKFNRYSSQGFYLKQQSYANNFYLSSNYTNNNQRFGYYFYVLNNGNKNQENGGIQDGRLNDSTVNINKALLKVKLNGANRDNRETKLAINPWLRINRILDTTNGYNHFLQLKSKGSINIYKYKDTKIFSDKYYDLIYLDTTSTRDSSNVKQFSNEIDYTLLRSDNKLGWSVGYKNEITRVWQHTNDLLYNNLFVSDLTYRSHLNNKDTLPKGATNLETHLNFQYVFVGANSGNYKAESNSSYLFDRDKSKSISFALLYEKRNPDRIYNTWISNHFVWTFNGYKPQEQLQAKLGVQLGRIFKASVFYQNTLNYLYFDESALPKQNNSAINNIGLSLSYSGLYFKHLGFIAEYTFQQTSNTSLLRLPQNSGTTKLFYTGSLFKNALQLQIGSQVQVYQDFYAYNYMPATQVFYLQNAFQTNAFPFLDVFLNARIRPVSIFLKMENALSGLNGLSNNYALVPGYYQTPRAFRFGLTWLFFD